MSQNNKPLVQIKVRESKDGTVIFLEAMDIYSEPIARVTNKKENKDYIITLDIVKDLNPEGLLAALDQLDTEIGNHRYQVNHPIKFVKGVMERSTSGSFPEDKNEDYLNFGRNSSSPYQVFVLERDEYKIGQYIPYLRWHIMECTGSEEDAWKGECWILHITGFEHKVFGSARWYDAEGIKRLAESLINDRALKITAGLSAPAEARVVSSLLTSEEILNKYKNRLEELMSILKNSLILKYSDPYNDNGTYAKIDSVSLGGTIIAYKVNPPYSPIFKEEENLSILEKYKEKKRENKYKREFAQRDDEERKGEKMKRHKEVRSKWLNVFIKEAKDKGWRVCNPYDKENDALDPWFTKLSEEEWETVRPAFSRLKFNRDTAQDFVF